MDPTARNSIEGYFSNPVGYKKGYSAGKSPVSVGVVAELRADRADASHAQGRPVEEQQLGDVNGKIEERLKAAGLTDLAKNVERHRDQARRTADRAVRGARGRSVLSAGIGGNEAHPAPRARSDRRGVGVAAAELGRTGGHTDAAQYSGLYSNWELSTDRANAARRVLEENGVAQGRITKVAGLADRDLRIPENPLDPRNRRISIVLPFSDEARFSDGHAQPARSDSASWLSAGRVVVTDSTTRRLPFRDDQARATRSRAHRSESKYRPGISCSTRAPSRARVCTASHSPRS